MSLLASHYKSGRQAQAETWKRICDNDVDADQESNSNGSNVWNWLTGPETARDASLNADTDRCWSLPRLYDESGEQMMIFSLGNTDACE